MRGRCLARNEPSSTPEQSFGVRHSALMTLAGSIAFAMERPSILAVAGVTSFAVWIVRRWGLPPRFGAANAVTTARLVFVAALLVGSLENAWIALGATVVFGLDGLDGWVARRFDCRTEFGARYDMEVDAFLVLAVALLLTERAGIAPWVLVAGFWRYVYVLVLRAVPSSTGEAPRSALGRWIFFVMMACFILAFVAPRPMHGYLALAGTLVMSASFARSLYYSYAPPRW